jgi:hypothetical protein
VIYKKRNFTVPNGVKIIQVSYDGSDNAISYVGVTSGSQHTLESFTGGDAQPITPHGVWCITHKNSEEYIHWVFVRLPYDADPKYRLSWSPEINKQTPTVTDY